jgi:hypothetical protein
MGFFTKDAQPVGGEALAPLSRDRVRAYLDSQQYRYEVDDDGDLWGWWDQHGIWFLLLGAQETALFVRAQYNRKVPVDRLGQVLEIANAWSQSHPWPHVYAVPDPDGVYLLVYAHHAVAYPTGVSDERLADHITCGIETTLPFFDHLDTFFPEAVAEAHQRLGITGDDGADAPA